MSDKELLQGTDKNDVITAGDNNNVVDAMGGDDVVYGSGGNDEIIGGSGNDVLYGGQGSLGHVGTTGVDIITDTTVTMRFDGESAGYKNSVGFYKIDTETGKMSDVQMVWENASLERGGIKKGTEFKFDVKAGEKIGFFIIANGYSQNQSFKKFGDGEFQFRAPKTGDIATIDGGTPELVFVQDDGDIIKVKGNVFHSTGDEKTFGLNPDKIAHAKTALDVDEGTIKMGFEDLYRGGDKDFNDVQLTVDIGVRNAHAQNSTGSSDRAGKDDDIIKAGEGDDKVFAGSGDDIVDGGAGNDILFGDSGKDKVHGGEGKDEIYGGTGNDSVHGGLGDDHVEGGKDDDFVEGNEGDDFLKGDTGNDKVSGGEGADEIHGGEGDDKASGGLGNDQLFGGKGNDELHGDEGNDELHGHSGDDILYGGSGDDKLFGTKGNDQLFGGDGADMLVGGSGDDILAGGKGVDIMSGGSGKDTYRFFNEDLGDVDVIQDFKVHTTDGDILDFSSMFTMEDSKTLSDYISLNEIDDGTVVRVDSDGLGAFDSNNDVVLLEDKFEIDLDDLMDHGQIMIS